MSNVVLIRELTEIMKMKNYYEAFLVGKNPPGSIFSAKTKACVITAYKSGKVLFQGANSEEEAKKWGESSS